MAFWPEFFFLPDMAIWQEISFRPEMVMNQNWTNQLHFGQNGFLDRSFFCQKCLFGRNCCSAANAFWPKMLLSSLNWLCGQRWIFGSNGFSAEIAFCPIMLISNLKWLFGQKCFFWQEMFFFFKWICLTSQSIERFGSPLMAESFQACYQKPFFNKLNPSCHFEPLRGIFGP